MEEMVEKKWKKETKKKKTAAIYEVPATAQLHYTHYVSIHHTPHSQTDVYAKRAFNRSTLHVVEYWTLAKRIQWCRHAARPEKG